MAPQTTFKDLNKQTGERLAHPPPGEEVVISGISGSFPQCDDIHELRDKLLNKIDMITERTSGQEKKAALPTREGVMRNKEKFDNTFFGISDNEANIMDPITRMSLEKTIEAIMDAGVNPCELRGRKIGVYIVSCQGETERVHCHETSFPNPHAVTATERVSLANKVSQYLHVNGPSISVDTACSSSGYALTMAYEEMRDGLIEAAIVGGGNTVMSDLITMYFYNLGVLSHQGTCKVFDDKANGYVRSEAACVVFLQKAKDARRVYSKILHIKTNFDGYKPRGIAFPSSIAQEELFTGFYHEASLSPLEVDYIEAHGTGTEVGDPEEANALATVFLRGRKQPLPIGSVKSNIGHTEGVSMLCSITKAILCMEMGMLLPNLHFETPSKKIESLVQGKFKVVTDVIPFAGKTIGLNSFGFGGANCHILLGANEKKMKNGGKPSDNLPRLVILSGRTQDGIRSAIESIQSTPVNAEFINLLQGVFSKNIQGHRFRGYTILTPGEKTSGMSVWSEIRPPLWFSFSGLGSQWPGMGEPLLQIASFAAVIDKCDRTLKPLGVDIRKVITDKNPQIFSNPINCLVGIAAVQIGLVEILRSIGVVPDGITGHSIGDLICAYVDNSLTLEQTILVAYYRGLVCSDPSIPRQSLIVCDKDSVALLKKDLEVVGSISNSDCIVAGDPKAIEEFTKTLQGLGKKADTLNCRGVGYHSASLAASKSALLQHLRKVIPHPKVRSDSWISLSSRMQQKSDQELSSAEYHTETFLNQATFVSISQYIPVHAICLDISPKSTSSLANLELYNDQGLKGLLVTLGRLYQRGIGMDLRNLYPPVQYPVSRGTPMISPLIKWNHPRQWSIADDTKGLKAFNSQKEFIINIRSPADSFLLGHNIDGRNLFPATGYLAMVWETFAQMHNNVLCAFDITFRDIRFQRATHIPKEGRLNFTITLLKVSGKFEVMEGGSSIVTGYVSAESKPLLHKFELQQENTSKDVVDFAQRDIYKELKLRGYNYSGLFRSLLSVNQEHTRGEVQWKDNWIAFMDNMLQVHILAHDSRSLYVPTYIHEMSINTAEHKRCLERLGENAVLPININNVLGVYRAGGVQIRGIKASPIARRKPLGEPVLERHQFTPYCVPDDKQYTLEQVLTVCVHVQLENHSVMKLKTAELINPSSNPDTPPVSPLLIDIVEKLPLMQTDATIFADGGSSRFAGLHPELKVESRYCFGDEKSHLVVVSDAVNDKDLLSSALSSLTDGGCIVTREQPQVGIDHLQNVDIVLDYVAGNERILMMKKRAQLESSADVAVFHVTQNAYEWMPKVQEAIKKVNPEKRVYLVAQREPQNGILGLFNCLYKELGSTVLRCVFILDNDAPPFDLALPVYQEQLKKDLAVNVLKDGQWGSYRHLLLENVPLIDSRHAYCHVASYGDLNSMTWYQGSEFNTPIENFQSRGIVHVYYSALNFRDIMLATGKLTPDIVFKKRTDQDCVLGFEFSGRTVTGERVMGLVERGAISNIARSKPALTWTVPDHWSLEGAATVPAVYGTVLYAFIISGRIKKGESILIHAGTGGIGQAAINLALHYGLTVFTTVGTEEKRNFISRNFPQIPYHNIGNSRDTSFEEMVMRETGGRGVDLVLNSLAGDKLEASVRCLAPGGRFLEIGKFDLGNNKQLGMDFLLKNKSYHGVMLDVLFSASEEEQMELHALVKEGVDSGAVKPLNARTLFSENEVEQAYRYMAAGKHMGKVLIKIRDEEPDKKAVPSLKIIKAQPRFHCDENMSYIIAGGLGGFGLELADWLVCRGAQVLVLTSRRGIVTGYQSSRVRTWRKYGVKVLISTCDISTHDGVKQLLTEANKLAPVGGIFNLAVVLHDALFENQTTEKFRESAKPKSIATHHFDVLSRELCPHLQYFVAFSSVSCGRGNVGQTNYGMSNSVMERICEARVRDGLPGVAIQWGAIGEVGLVADMMEDSRELVIGGTLQQTVSSCLKVMDNFLQQQIPVVASMVVAEKLALSSSRNLSERVLGILGMHDISKVRPNTSLSDLGMDSMTGVEIKQVMEQEFEIFLTPNDIRELTVAQLEELASAKNDSDEKEEATENVLDAVLNLGTYELAAMKQGQSSYSTVVQIPSLLKTATQVFLIPGAEGLSTTLEPLASKLKGNLTCLQWFSSSCSKGVKDTAKFFIPKLLAERKNADAPVLLVGFSFGGLVSLEIAAALEEQGHQCKIVLIDSSPESLSKPLAYYLDKGDDFLQLSAADHIIEVLKLVPSGQKQQVVEEMQAMTWEKRMEWISERVSANTKLPADHFVKVVDETLHRMIAVSKYSKECNLTVRAPVMLLRPTKAIAKMELKDYGLSKYCKNVEAVHLIEGNHTKILEHPDTAKYINEFLKL